MHFIIMQVFSQTASHGIEVARLQNVAVKHVTGEGIGEEKRMTVVWWMGIMEVRPVVTLPLMDRYITLLG